MNAIGWGSSCSGSKSQSPSERSATPQPHRRGVQPPLPRPRPVGEAEQGAVLARPQPVGAALLLLAEPDREVSRALDGRRLDRTGSLDRCDHPIAATAQFLDQLVEA